MVASASEGGQTAGPRASGWLALGLWPLAWIGAAVAAVLMALPVRILLGTDRVAQQAVMVGAHALVLIVAGCAWRVLTERQGTGRRSRIRFTVVNGVAAVCGAMTVLLGVATGDAAGLLGRLLFLLGLLVLGSGFWPLVGMWTTIPSSGPDRMGAGIWLEGAAVAIVTACLAVPAASAGLREFQAASGYSPDFPIHTGDLMWVARPTRERPLRVGDVVVLEDQGPSERAIIRSVAAVAGEPVPNGTGAIVPHGKVWVLGSRDQEGSDSRSFGAVAVTSMIGRVEWIVWPPARWGAVDVSSRRGGDVMEPGPVGPPPGDKGGPAP